MRIRTGDERHRGGDLVNIPVAVQCCGSLLRHGPIARCEIQIRVDRTGLDVVDGDTASTDLPGQTLSKGLHGSRVNAVAPGVIDTEMSNFTKTEAGRDVAVGMQALKRIGKPEDIADVVAFLVLVC
jgi:hypothetical protein